MACPSPLLYLCFGTRSETGIKLTVWQGLAVDASRSPTSAGLEDLFENSVSGLNQPSDDGILFKKALLSFQMGKLRLRAG